MHIVRSDLHLNGFASRPHDGRVQRLVVIVLGVGDVIVEFTRQIGPQVVHGPEGGITILDRVDKDADCTNVIEILQTAILALHFAPDAVDMFRPARNFGFYALFLELRLQG